MRLGKHLVQWAFCPQGHTQAYTAMRSQHFFQCAAAYGGPPQHFTEAWQDELWKNLSMHPVEQSHLKGPATSPAKSTQLFAPPLPCSRSRISALSTTDEHAIKMSAATVAPCIGHDKKDEIEAF